MINSGLIIQPKQKVKADHSMKLKNKIAVVTGGNSGIGLATARELKENGARVVIVGRNTEAVGKAASELGADTLGVTADVSRVAELQQAFKMIGAKAGRLDILFVNAGIAQFAPITDSTESLFDAMTNTNFKGAFFTIQSALPLMPEGSSIVLAYHNRERTPQAWFLNRN